MLRFSWSATGPRLAKNAAWYAVLGGLAAYMLWQAVVLVLAVAAYAGRVQGDCLIGPECRLTQHLSDGALGFLAVVMATASLGLLSLLVRLLVRFWRQAFWTAVGIRVLGWITLVVGLATSLAWGLPWFILGLWLVLWSKGLDYEVVTDPSVIEGERL